MLTEIHRVYFQLSQPASGTCHTIILLVKVGKVQAGHNMGRTPNKFSFENKNFRSEKNRSIWGLQQQLIFMGPSNLSERACWKYEQNF